MKKIFNNILVLLALLIIIITGASCYIYRTREESEVLNSDVSMNDVKCILRIDSESQNDYVQIPIGYKSGKIYVLNYNDKDKIYDCNIYILNKDGSLKDSGIKLPDEYSKGNLYVIGDKIFSQDKYFDLSEDENHVLFSDLKYDVCCAVSGNDKYVVFSRDIDDKKEYVLYNIEDNSNYKYQMEKSNEICNIFFDSETNKFYAICSNNVIYEIVQEENEFTLLQKEKIEDINDNYDYKYAYGFDGQIFLSSKKIENNNEYSLEQFNLKSGYLEKIQSINLCAYDKLYSQYVILKKNESNNDKIYFAKFQNTGFEMLMQVPKIYGQDSSISINMIDTDNVLIHEQLYDNSNNKIKNVYRVYDLITYFQQNNGENSWNIEEKVTLNNAFKNIDKYNENRTVENKTGENDNNEKKKENEENYSKIEPKQTVSAPVKNEEPDYRETSPSWKRANGDWYYYDNRDKKVTGWVKTQKGWYYFYTDGVMQKNSLVIEDGNEYYLGEDGLLTVPDDNLEENSSGYYDEEKKEKVNSNNSDREENRKNLGNNNADAYDKDKDVDEDNKENTNEEKENKNSEEKNEKKEK
ncbi:hypothetical protein [uncultured Clostridium sp.]|uniref:hypothetical protein n=1 Tax=uncultured Clostridium sp. TaxID=59620 RepID=UPI0025E1A514|nr:hypothetical protein [uncultured Clostridium sp.]